VWLTGLDRDDKQVSREVDRTGRLVSAPLAGERVLADDGTFLVSGALPDNAHPTLNLRARATRALVRVLGVGTVITSGTDHIVWADDQGTRHLVERGRDARVLADEVWVAISPDGTRLAWFGPNRQVQVQDGTGLHAVAVPGVPQGPRAEWVGGMLLVPVRDDYGQTTVAVIGVEDRSAHLMRIRNGFRFLGAF
jgi:hypothetical protein